MQSDRHQRISERAYHIWLVEGCVHGRDHEHWHRAEREIAEEEARVASALANRAAGAAKTGARRRPQTNPASSASSTTTTRRGRRPSTKAPSR